MAKPRRQHHRRRRHLPGPEPGAGSRFYPEDMSTRQIQAGCRSPTSTSALASARTPSGMTSRQGCCLPGPHRRASPLATMSVPWAGRSSSAPPSGTGYTWTPSPSCWNRTTQDNARASARWSCLRSGLAGIDAEMARSAGLRGQLLARLTAIPGQTGAAPSPRAPDAGQEGLACTSWRAAALRRCPASSTRWPGRSITLVTGPSCSLSCSRTSAFPCPARLCSSPPRSTRARAGSTSWRSAS